MGLDMYLSAGFYVGGWEFSNEEDKQKYASITEILGIKDFKCEGSPSITVNVNVAYWRKANAIHNWFVEKCQDGKDECQKTYVERSTLEELVEDCKTVLASSGTEKEKETIESLLPPTSGFFFGSTEIDEGYWQDLQDTIEQIEGVLNDPRFKGKDFYYQSSW